MEILLIVTMVISLIMVVIGIIGMIYDHIQNKSKNQIKIEDLTIPKTKYTQMVIDWCVDNIKSPNPQPYYQLKYHANKKQDGNYDPRTNTMTIYLGNINTLLQLTEIIIHEYVHSVQNQKGFIQKYEEQTTTKGYWNNPYEIESRKQTKIHQYQCLRSILHNKQTILYNTPK